jgi:tRNA 2-thiouridine synthesizing protein A
MSQAIVQQLDVQGLACPMPIAKAAIAIRSMRPGDRLEVLATDPGSVPDFAAWCAKTGNDLLERTQDAGVFRFLILKG